MLVTSIQLTNPLPCLLTVPSLTISCHLILLRSTPKMPPKTTSPTQEIPTADLKAIASKSDSAQVKLQEAASAAESALAAQKTASSLRSAAATITDPKKREKFLTDAYNKEVEAHGNSKKARVLTSGAFQGGVSGAGIGAAVSAGLGTVVGTVVGTVTAIPVTAVGGLAGVATGAVHGPWIKLGKIGGKKDGEEGAEVEEAKEGDEDAVPNPEVLRRAAEEVGKVKENGGNDVGEKKDGEQKERKKPRKLEVRNKQAQAA